jgi:hypothetical protein
LKLSSLTTGTHCASCSCCLELRPWSRLAGPPPIKAFMGRRLELMGTLSLQSNRTGLDWTSWAVPCRAVLGSSFPSSKSCLGAKSTQGVDQVCWKEGRMGRGKAGATPSIFRVITHHLSRGQAGAKHSHLPKYSYLTAPSGTHLRKERECEGNERGLPPKGSITAVTSHRWLEWLLPPGRGRGRGLGARPSKGPGLPGTGPPPTARPRG